MSKVMPSAVASVLRANTDTLVGYVGQDCRLHRIATESTDKLRDATDYTYEDPVDTQVQIEWSPNVRLLRSLGLYTEEKAPLPILAYFKFEDDVEVGDWIELDFEYSVGQEKTNQFTIIDRKIQGRDVEARAVWLLAPRRKP